MNAVRQFYLRSWRGIVLTASLAVVGYFLYFRRLSSLVPGYSQPEINSFKAVGSWHSIINNPVDAPYKVFAWLFTGLLHHSILADRGVDAAIGVLVALLFFAVVRSWCSFRVAFFATIMFATSSGLLHFARIGTGDILQMAVLALLAVTVWYRKQREHRVLIGFLLIALFVVMWYIPGMLWFELLGLIPLRTTIGGQLSRTKNLYLAGMAVLFLALLTPLAYASSKHPGVLLQIAGLPSNLHSVTHVGHSFISLLLSIVVYSSGNALYWVGHAPLLSAIEVIACLLGVYYVWRQAPVRRTFLFGSLALGLVLVSLGGSVTFACLVPILYLFIAIGIDHMLNRWLTVFPRNPIAQITGNLLVCILVIFSVFYQVQAYYVAWPHAPATRATFHNSPL